MDQSSKKSLEEDAELMRKAADGDTEAFEQLNKKYALLLKQFFVIHGADRNSVDDLVQKIFTSLWQQRKNFLKESNFGAYLYSIARNTLYNEIRRSKRMAGINSIKHSEFGASTNRMLSQPEAVLYLKELKEALEAAKAKLTIEQRQALEAFQYQDIALDKKSEQ